jgi:hypothetical protein
MEKLDLTRKYKAYYAAKREPTVVEFPEARYLAIEGKGDPNSETFAQKIQTLYPVAYGVKFLCKTKNKDFVVPKLEGLWWFDEKYLSQVTLSEAPQRIPRSEWYWKLMVRMPDFVTSTMVRKVVETVLVKKNLVQAKAVELFTLPGQKVVQILHLGSFDKEPETLLQLQEYMKANNLQQNGLHHEIYLSDFRKTAPEKLRTILREPIR